MTTSATLVTMNRRHCGVQGTPGVAHRLMEVAGGPVSLYAAGRPDRSAVILLHGAMYDEARFVWDQLFPVLAEEFRVIAVDTPRHGGSRPWAGELGRDRLLAILIELLDELALDRCSLVGLSMGGGLAIALAASQPDRIRSAVLFEPGGLGERLDRQLLAWLYLRTPGVGRLLSRRYAKASDAELRKLLASLYVGGSTPTDADRLIGILRDEIRGKTRFRERDLDDWQRESIGPFRTRTVLDLVPEIACPTLWLRGAGGELVKQSEMERAVGLCREAGRDASLTVVPGAGHLLPLERPDEANAAVLEFLRRHATS